MALNTRVQNWEAITLSEADTFAAALELMTRGGYQLAKAADQILLSEVILCLEGEPNSVDPSSGSPERQVINALADELRRQRTTRLAATTLADLQQDRDARLQAQAMYFI